MYDSIRSIHIEITTRCNASCPQCPRNIDGGPVNPNLPLTELSLAEIKAILPPSLLGQLKAINFCGNYGDPSVARDLLPILEYLRATAPHLHLAMNTNGGARNPAWWASLAGLLDLCIFSIDGLEDTNHLYRRNIVWSAVMANATAYLQAGGRAGWDYLIFKHNQHQVDAAEQLSRSMGFIEFNAKRSGRFLKDNALLQSVPVRNQQGDLVYTLQPPTRKKYLNPTGDVIASKFSTEAAYETYLTSTPVTCPAQQGAKIFLSAEGLVFPCCWMGQLYPVGSMSRRKQQMHDLIKTLPEGRSSIDAHLHTIEEIVAAPLFQKDIPAGWQPGPQRLRVCAKFCGQHAVSSEQQLAPHELHPPTTLQRVSQWVRQITSTSAKHPH